MIAMAKFRGHRFCGCKNFTSYLWRRYAGQLCRLIPFRSYSGRDILSATVPLEQVFTLLWFFKAADRMRTVLIHSALVLHGKNEIDRPSSWGLNGFVAYNNSRK